MDLKRIGNLGYRLLNWIFGICFFLVVLSLGWRNGRFWAILAVAGSYWVFRRFPRIPLFTLWLFLGTVAVNLVWVLWLDPRPASDFSLMHSAAQSLLRGDLSFNAIPYFILWSYQLPFVALEALLLWFWNDPMCIQIFNCLCAAGSVCLLYRMLRGQVSGAAAKTTAVCLMMFPTIGAMSSLLTNQCAGAFFLILGVWLVCSDDGKKLGFARYPLAGLAIQMGNLLRPEGVIVLVALLAYGVFFVLRHPDTVKRAALAAAALAAVYLLTGAAANQAVIRTGLSPHGVGNQLPQWKFVCGTSFETNGGYAAKDYELLADTLDEHSLPTERTDAVVREILSERLSHPLTDWTDLLRNKLDRFWNKPGTGWAFVDIVERSPDFQKSIRPVIEEFDRTLFWLAAMLSLAGVLLKKKEPRQFVPYFVFFAAFAAFLLIEVQPRYAYLPDFFLIAAGAWGIARIEQFFANEADKC